MSGESSGKLTARSAAACENAKSPRSACKCRCGGAAHGLSRGAVRELDAGDPHHPDDESPKAKKERLRDEQWRQRLANWNKPIGSPDPLPATLPIGTMATFGDVEALTQPELRPRFPQGPELVYWARWGLAGMLEDSFVRPLEIDWDSVARLREKGSP